MTDTTREAFEAWKNAQEQAEPEPERTYEFTDDGMNELIDSVMFQAWQAATERATQVERERCALVCKTVAAEYCEQVQGGDYSGKSDAKEDAADECAAAIRQGGDT